MNWIDLICTLWALRRGCVELNPLMQSVTMMLWYKAAAIPALVLWLKHCGTREARRGLALCAIVYGARMPMAVQLSAGSFSVNPLTGERNT